MSSAMSDSSAIYSRYGTDPDLGELVVMYVDEMPQRIQTLEAYLAAEDLEGLHRFAHQLKGAAGSYGFDQVSEAASVLEGALQRRESPEIIDATFAELVGICRRVRAGANQ